MGIKINDKNKQKLRIILIYPGYPPEEKIKEIFPSFKVVKKLLMMR